MTQSKREILLATSRGLFAADRTGAVAFDGRDVNALTVSRNTLLAVVDRHELWRASDGAPEAPERWTRFGTLADEVSCLLERDGAVWIGTEGAHLYRLPALQGAEESPVEPVDAFESHPDRERWYTPWGGPPAVRSVSATADGDLFVNVHVGGVLRSSDEGASWTQTIDIGIDVHQVLALDRPPLVLAPTGKGFAVSADRGSSWSVATEGLDFRYMRAVTVAGDTIFASASDGPHGSRGAVYRRPIGSDQPFERCVHGLPEWFGGNVDTFCLQTAEHAVVIGSPEGSVFVSEDQGEHWDQVVAGLPAIRAVSVR